MPDASRPTHEQRLAAKLRENLKRRKEQARARAAHAAAQPANPAPDAMATGGKPPSDSESTLAPADRVALKPGPESDS